MLFTTSDQNSLIKDSLLYILRQPHNKNVTEYFYIIQKLDVKMRFSASIVFIIQCFVCIYTHTNVVFFAMPLGTSWTLLPRHK